MRKIWIFLVLICLLPTRSFASVEFFALLPNPAGDDTLGEYIEIRNTGCQAVDIGGYRLYDAANKSYIIPASTIIGSQGNLTFPYAETKIALNNSGDESITLTDASGILIDTESYAGTQGDNIVISLTTTDEDCSVIPPGEDNTGTTTEQNPPDPLYQGGSGTIDTGSGSSETSGGQGAGVTDSGATSTGATSIGATSIGATSTGTTDTGSTSTGVVSDNNTPTIEHSNTGILFPDIFPTRQEPTNATLSGNIWDCGLSQPCRVNVTFDTIFTGGLLAKDYVCEVITATGTFTTCNPNTLYFSTDSSFSLRLTSKIDPSQSRTVSWDVSFIVSQDNSSTGGMTNTGTTEQNPPSPLGQGGTGTTSIGVTSPSSGSTSSGIIFPEIIPIYQNYTNTTNSGDTLTCITSPCRVNFTLDPIFTGPFVSRDYTCEIRHGTGVYDSCNPPQLYPVGTGAIEIILTHRASGDRATKTIEILQQIPIATVSSKNTANIVPTDIAKDTTKPVAIIDFDGKLKSYYEQVNDYEFNCYAMTCSVNLTAERSYDPDGGSIRYLWIYGQNEIKTTKDPGTQKYTIGDHLIVFRVIDMAGNYDEIRYIVHVLGPKTEEEKEKTKTKIKKERSGASETSGGQKKKKKKKLKKMDFFDPPIITLQDSKFVEGDSRYICRTTSKTCSLNLTLSGAEKGIEYTWIYDDGDIVTSKNPRSHSFTPGVHTVTVTASYSGSIDILWTQILSVQVDKITKAKKPKKIKVQKIPKTEIKKETKSIIIPISDTEQVPTDDIPYTTIALLSGIMPLILLRRFLTGVI